MHYSSYIALALYWSGEYTIAVILHWLYTGVVSALEQLYCIGSILEW